VTSSLTAESPTIRSLKTSLVSIQGLSPPVSCAQGRLVNEVHADEVHTYEMYAGEVHANEMHARKIHAYETHTHQVHACRMYVDAHDIHGVR
jgi:hypothetical protein